MAEIPDEETSPRPNRLTFEQQQARQAAAPVDAGGNPRLPRCKNCVCGGCTLGIGCEGCTTCNPPS